MLKSKKHVFWEALLITIVIFLAGLFLGMLIEATNSSKISNLYTKSEISLTDATASMQLLEDTALNCEEVKDIYINFANEIYEEAKTLELYEDSEKLTDSMKLLHKKYDLLRTLLWKSNKEYLEKCNNYDLLVYLYQYESEDAEIKATQNVWSKILLEAKEENQDILLIPIAVDQNLTSLKILTEEYTLERFPAVIINNQQVLYEIENKETIKEALN